MSPAPTGAATFLAACPECSLVRAVTLGQALVVCNHGTPPGDFRRSALTFDPLLHAVDPVVQQLARALQRVSPGEFGPEAKR